jgi:hypothetical protein
LAAEAVFERQQFVDIALLERFFAHIVVEYADAGVDFNLEAPVFEPLADVLENQ